MSLLHIGALLSPRSSKRIVSIRIMIDKGWAFAVNEDHSSYDDAAQVALKELLASGANARETGGLVLDSPACGGWAQRARNGAPFQAMRRFSARPRISRPLTNSFHRRVSHPSRTIGRG
jgi:hypothetical protein